jgi:hypothetical protein
LRALRHLKLRVLKRSSLILSVRDVVLDLVGMLVVSDLVVGNALSVGLVVRVRRKSARILLLRWLARTQALRVLSGSLAVNGVETVASVVRVHAATDEGVQRELEEKVAVLSVVLVPREIEESDVTLVVHVQIVVATDLVGALIDEREARVQAARDLTSVLNAESVNHGWHTDLRVRA